ncbi:nucleotidyl transferase AbiEii/AbiGii toxin family protein [uncultured Microscilla sp.]|uniref:nucleotidyl transferase AbiEii/AbiGii toxin family protein n=1 Tax=uncultured Microscilla sp. TaxID=432653 RepID=UPI0026029362|nr:nucleotidyl transferase AbiEii/AbiGii toxin family protein [uncultured Microscilla sp.]
MPIQQLQQIAQQSVYTPAELLQLHVFEGIIRRVAMTEFSQTLVLRGGMMSRHWYAPGKWMPSDIDFMVPTPIAAEAMEEAWRHILSQVPAPDDQVRFLTKDLHSEVTWAEAKDPGLRVFVQAEVAQQDSLLSTQIDISYADPVVPAATVRAYTTVLAIPALPQLKMVHRETSAGWKFYGLFERKRDKWRPKDLFGLYWLLTHNDLNLAQVMASFRETSVERGTPLGMAARFFEGTFARGKGSQRLWRGFCRTHPSFDLPEKVEEVVQTIRQQLAPHFKQLLHTHSHMVALGERGFPLIKHLQDVLPAIAERDEFQVYTRDSYQIVDYKNQLKYSFLPVAQAMHPSVASIYALRRECRGLIFNKRGELVHRKLHKFFRIDENEESRLTNIDWTHPCLVLEKLDGSLVAPIVWQGTLRWTTRKGLSTIADQAGAFAERQQKNGATTGYLPMVQALLKAGWTPCFEWCSRQHPIVLDHPNDRLVLTAVRHNTTGHYLNFDTMVALAQRHQVAYIKQVGILTNVEEAQRFIEAATTERQGEGYILRFPDDRFYKVKNKWYQKLHQLVAHESNEVYIWQATLKGEIADMLAGVAPGLRPNIQAFSNTLATAVQHLTQWLQDFVMGANEAISKATHTPIEANKLFALSYARRQNNLRESLAFKGWHAYQTHGKATNFAEIVTEILLAHCQTRQRLQRIRRKVLEG